MSLLLLFEFCPNLIFWVLSQWVLKFCWNFYFFSSHNLSFWSMNRFNLAWNMTNSDKYDHVTAICQFQIKMGRHFTRFIISNHLVTNTCYSNSNAQRPSMQRSLSLTNLNCWCSSCTAVLLYVAQVKFSQMSSGTIWDNLLTSKSHRLINHMYDFDFLKIPNFEKNLKSNL